MIVTFTCRHEENIRVTSKEHKAEVQAYAAEHKCRACEKLDIASQPRKEALDLPALKGSAKQITWAEEIRAKVVAHREEILPIMQKVAWDSTAHYPAYIIRVLDQFIESETSAAAWIDAFKPITSQYSDKAPAVHILGGLAQRSELFGLDGSDTTFLYDVGRYGTK